MNEILHANIFFVIASIATVCFCILISIVLYQLIKIMQSIRAILTRVEEGSEVIAEDLSHLRAAIMEGGIVSRLIGFFFGGMKSTAPRRKRTVNNRKQSKYGNQETDEEDRSL
jgi:hypothetical protein